MKTTSNTFRKSPLWGVGGLKLLLTLIIYHLSLIIVNAQSSVVLPAEVYQQLKAKGELKQNVKYHPIADTKSFSSSSKDKTHSTLPLQMNPASINACSCLVPIDSTFSVAPFTDGLAPEYRSDDGSTDVLLLPFDVCLYGFIYSQCFINNNGNITLDTAYGGYTAAGFPDSNSIMIAPFWSDVDTRDTNSGLVYYKITPTYAIVQWNNVGYYPLMSDKRNTFQVIITDGVDSILPAGQNIAFCYGDMQWTTGYGGTGGFGGTPATAGVNKGDGVNSLQIGRFDQPGIAYDGPIGNSDGVDFLDNQSFYANYCNSINMAPIASGLHNCDTIKICNLGDTLYFKELFLAPESSQTTTITVNLNSTPNSTVVSNVSGNSAAAIVSIVATAANAGYNTITFTATDNGIPARTTVIDAVVFVDLSGGTAINPVISGITTFCDGSSSVMSVTPTTYDNYVWSTVASGTSTTVTTSGICFVTASLNGCSASASTMITAHPSPTPIISGFPYTCSAGFNVTTLYCDSLIYSSYIWSNTNTNDSIFAGNGVYWLSTTNSFGCVGGDTVIVTPVAGNVTTTLAGATITAVAAGAGYQWLDCNNGNAIISGETNQSFTASVNGSYSVIVSNGICADTSGCVTITNIGVNEFAVSSLELQVYPNPVVGELRIINYELGIGSIKIYNVLGEVVFKSKDLSQKSKDVVLDVSELAKGVYFVEAASSDSSKGGGTAHILRTKFIKQ